jgi:hypothetical protein
MYLHSSLFYGLKLTDHTFKKDLIFFILSLQVRLGEEGKKKGQMKITNSKIQETKFVFYTGG